MLVSDYASRSRFDKMRGNLGSVLISPCAIPLLDFAPFTILLRALRLEALTAKAAQTRKARQENFELESGRYGNLKTTCRFESPKRRVSTTQNVQGRNPPGQFDSYVFPKREK